MLKTFKELKYKHEQTFQIRKYTEYTYIYIHLYN